MFKKSIMPMPPIPPVKDIPFILSVIKEGWELVKDIFGIGDKVGKSKQTNVDSCEISDLTEINNIFNEFILSIEPKVNKIEESVQEEMYYYLDELVEFLNDNNEKLKEKGIRTTTIERKIEKIKRNINGNLKKEISRNISLDNNECKKIIKMILGDRKTNTMNELFELSLNEAIENLIIDTREAIDELMDDIDFSIQDQLENLDVNIKNQGKILNILDGNSDETIEAKEIIIMNSMLLSEVSNYILETLSKGDEEYGSLG